MKKSPLILFVTQSGRYLSGVVKKREPGRIHLEGAAFVEIASDQTRFIFTPVKFASELFTLYETGLLGETEMPEIMKAGFGDYLKTLPGKKAKKK